MYDKKKQKKTSVDVKVLIKINVLHGIVHLFCADLKWIDKAAVVWRRLFSTVVLSPRNWIVGCYISVGRCVRFSASFYVCTMQTRSFWPWLCMYNDGTLFHWFVEWLFVPLVRLHFVFFLGLKSNPLVMSSMFSILYCFFLIGLHTSRLIPFTKLQEN